MEVLLCSTCSFTSTIRACGFQHEKKCKGHCVTCYSVPHVNFSEASDWILDDVAAAELLDFVYGMIDNLAEKVNACSNLHVEVVDRQMTWFNSRKHLLVNYKLDQPFLHASKFYKNLCKPSFVKRFLVATMHIFWNGAVSLTGQTVWDFFF